MKNPIIAMTLVAFALSMAAAGCGVTKDANHRVDSSCTPRHQFHTLEKGSLTVSTYTYAPATIVEGSDLSGVEGELLNKIGKWECVGVKVQEQSAAGVIPAVQAKRADIAAGSWYRTKDRASALILTEPIYTDSMVFTSKGGEVKTIGDLAALNVGTFEGNLWNDDLKELLGGRLKVYATEQETFKDLANGRIAVAVDGAGGTVNMLDQIGSSDLEAQTPPPDPRVKASVNPGQIGWPVMKGNPNLAKALSEDIAELRSDGEVQRLLKKYGYPTSAADVGKPSLL